jgi:hypothetical protein
MDFVCRHCDKFVNGTAYRVISEERGVILLDMLVCASCAAEAKNLGLEALQMELPKRSDSPRSQAEWRSRNQ